MMDSSHLDHEEKSSPETYSDSSMSLGSPNTNDIFEKPSVHPRVGDEYQVEIPPMLSNTEILQLMKNPADSKYIVDSSHSFLWGLPIPVMYLRKQQENHIETGRLVPGRPNELWSDSEADSFLLGLYLLGKNLLQVTRFVESKSVGQVLAYYYGQFYASAGYRRWSDCRKMRSRKCVIGPKFFSGYRQQELFSRVFPLLSEERKTKLLETSRAFALGSSSLDEYVFTLKALVGIKALVNAVSIGKGKEDLTVLTSDSSKNNQISSLRPEMPSGKACSTLTYSEILKYLTGDFRLSKARSNDLFWEAVWPRLLARGWHSEQPGGNYYKGSHDLVFLVPGLNKFSRRKLTKGEHYFDSISDVLVKVGCKPELLRLDDDDEENGCATKVTLEDDQDSSDQERHCYLKPRVSIGFSDLIEFTVVDTSLADDDNPCKVSELRSLPVEAKTELRDNVDVIKNGLHLIPFLPHNPMNHKARTVNHQFSRGAKPEMSSCGSSVTKRRKLSACLDKDVPCVLSLPAKNRNATVRIVGPKLSPTDIKQTSEDEFVTDNCNDQKSVESTSDGNNASSVISLENEKLSVAQEEIDLNLPQVSFEPKSYDELNRVEELSSFTQNSNVEKLNRFNVEIQKHDDVEKQKHSEDTIAPSVNMERQANSPSQEPSNPVLDFYQQPEKQGDIVDTSHDNMEPQVSSTELVNNVVGSDQPSRRQSTRNRPLTTKALEALEIDLSSPVRQYRKRSTPSLTQDQKPKRSRQTRNKSPVFSRDMVIDLQETCNGNTDMIPNTFAKNVSPSAAVQL